MASAPTTRTAVAAEGAHDAHAGPGAGRTARDDGSCTRSRWLSSARDHQSVTTTLWATRPSSPAYRARAAAVTATAGWRGRGGGVAPPGRVEVIGRRGPP